MTDYNEKIKNITFSYSNLSTFETCKYLWKMTYLEGIERTGNFFSEVGLAYHQTLEEYFKRNIASYEMEPYFRKIYSEIVIHDCPAFIKKSEEKYFSDGINFFSEFDFPIDDYEILEIEGKTETVVSNIMFVIKPDMILKNKKTEKIICLDYKTSTPYDSKGKIITEKILPYIKQLQLYSSLLWIAKSIEVNQLWLWFVRCGKIEKFLLNVDKANTNLQKFLEVIESIKQEKEFLANTNNKFYCDNLCSLGSIGECFFRNMEKE